MADKKIYVLKFRFRSFYCKKCDLHVQFSGNDPVVGMCPCGAPIVDLPLESDAWIESQKSVETK